MRFIIILLLITFSIHTYSQVNRYDSSLVKSCRLNKESDCTYYSDMEKTYLILTDQDSIIFVRDSSISEVIPFRNLNRTIYHLDNNRMVAYMTYQNWDSTEWKNYDHYDNIFYPNGNQGSRVYSGWSDVDSSWRFSTKDSFQYDLAGNMTLSWGMNWDTLSLSWVTSHLFSYSYDSFNRQTESIKENYYNGTVYSGTKNEKTYSASGKVTMNSLSNWNATYMYWKNYQKDEHSFDAADHDTLTINYTGDSINWINDNLKRHVFDINSNLIEESTQDWIAGSWVNLSRTIYTYNGSFDLLTKLTQTWSGGSWVDQYMTTNQYSPTHKVIQTVSSQWDGTTFQNTGMGQYTYDAVDSMIEILSLSWNGVSWDSSSRTTTFYFSYFPLAYSDYESMYFNSAWETISSSTTIYDTLNRIIDLEFDGHSGLSGGEFHYNYFPDGTYSYELDHHCSHSGMGAYLECYRYIPAHLISSAYDLSICENGQALPLLMLSGGTPSYHFMWTPSSGVDSTIALEPVLSPLNSTVYRVTAEDATGNISGFDINVTVNPDGFTLGPDSLICTGTTFQLSAGNSFTTYLWQDGSSGSGFNINTSTQSANIYWLTVTDSNNCTATDSVNILVDVCADIESIVEESIQLFPNPAHGKLNVTLPEATDASVQIYDQLGKMLSESEITNSSEKQIDISAMTPGIYLMRITSKQKTLQRQIVIY